MSPLDLQDLLQTWGYGLVFLAMVLESAGLPLPGETITLLGGYAAGNGHLNGFGVVAAAASGAMVGDTIGYWIGRRVGWAFLRRISGLLKQSPEQLEQLRHNFLRHAGKSVFLGRFVAVLRVLAGPMAGAVGMPYRRFLVCNAAGALLWASTMVGLAWIGGRWIPPQRLMQGVVEFGLGALGLVSLVLLIPWLLARLERRQLDGEGDA